MGKLINPLHLGCRDSEFEPRLLYKLEAVRMDEELLLKSNMAFVTSWGFDSLRFRNKKKESWVSGLNHLFAKQATCKRVHKFESCTLRKNKITMENNTYNKEEILLAGMLGELNTNDTKHLISMLDEAKEISSKIYDCRTCKFSSYDVFDDIVCANSYPIPEADCNGGMFVINKRFVKQ